MPPLRLRSLKYSVAPSCMSFPSCSDGPLNAADWPRTISLSVTPWAIANLLAASPGAVIHARMLPPPVAAGSAGEDLAHLVHEALGARVVPVSIAAVYLIQLAQQLALPLGEPYRRFHRHLAEQ